MATPSLMAANKSWEPEVAYPAPPVVDVAGLSSPGKSGWERDDNDNDVDAAAADVVVLGSAVDVTLLTRSLLLLGLW